MIFVPLLVLSFSACSALGLDGNGMTKLQLEKCRSAILNLNARPATDTKPMLIRLSEAPCNGPVTVPPYVSALGLDDCYAAVISTSSFGADSNCGTRGACDTASAQHADSSPSKLAVAMYSLFSASLVGLSGIFPLVVLPNINGETRSLAEREKILKRLLSFSVGGLLGDVFLHLLPESWSALQHSGNEHDHMGAVINGLWVLIGLFSFLMLEKVFQALKNGSSHAEADSKFFSGYLNLIANFIDNFTHGLAIGGSYLVGRWVGLLTTLAILIHEMPHEIGDFAILLRAGFNRWTAAKLQMLTATGGLLGAAFVLVMDSSAEAGAKVAWILPFTSGGFIYIALCSVVPDLLKETSPKESVVHLIFVVVAMAIMGLVSMI